MWRVAIPPDSGQTAAINGLESNGNSGSHAPDLHAASRTGIPSRIQMSDLIHLLSHCSIDHGGERNLRLEEWVWFRRGRLCLVAPDS
jgi:hypothetical protein